VMAATVSPATGRYYGVARVCQVWDVPRVRGSAPNPSTPLARPPPPAPRSCRTMARIRFESSHIG
jgi:hypothetical protein